MGTLGATRERCRKTALNIFCVHFLNSVSLHGLSWLHFTCSPFSTQSICMKLAATEKLNKKKKTRFRRSAHRDAAAGWREAFQGKRLHGVSVYPLKLGLQVKLLTSFGPWTIAAHPLPKSPEEGGVRVLMVLSRHWRVPRVAAQRKIRHLLPGFC